LAGGAVEIVTVIGEIGVGGVDGSDVEPTRSAS
jgi:hypothetical protein